MAAGEMSYGVHMVHARLYYVLAYDHAVYDRWCRRMGIHPWRGNVRYIADRRSLGGAAGYRVILLEDYYNPRRRPLMEFMEFEGNPRADAVYPVPPYVPIVASEGLIVDMRCRENSDK